MKHNKQALRLGFLFLVALLLAVLAVSVFAATEEEPTPVNISIVGGTLYIDDKYCEPYTEADPLLGDQIYMIADPAEEGYIFFRWEINIDGNTSFVDGERASCSIEGATNVTITAVYKQDIGLIEVTFPEPTFGGTYDPSQLIGVGANAEHYSLGVWYMNVNNKDGSHHDMAVEEKYPTDSFYTIFYFWIYLDEAYWVSDGSETMMKINDQYIEVNKAYYDEHKIGVVYKYYDLCPVEISVTGGTLYHNGEPTTETSFLPGTVLTVKADPAQYPEGQTFRYWYIDNS